MEDKKKKRILFINKYLFLAIVIVLVGSVFIGNGFYSYTNVDKEGIQARNGLLTKETTQDWEYVESVTTTYSISHNHKRGDDINLHYNLQMANGRVVNLYGSPDFFTHIVKTDRYLQGLGIPIYKSGIHPKDYGLFVEHFEGPGKLTGINRLEVVEGILME